MSKLAELIGKVDNDMKDHEIQKIIDQTLTTEGDCDDVITSATSIMFVAFHTVKDWNNICKMFDNHNITPIMHMFADSLLCPESIMLKYGRRINENEKVPYMIPSYYQTCGTMTLKYFKEISKQNILTVDQDFKCVIMVTFEDIAYNCFITCDVSERFDKDLDISGKLDGLSKLKTKVEFCQGPYEGIREVIFFLFGGKQHTSMAGSQLKKILCEQKIVCVGDMYVLDAEKKIYATVHHIVNMKEENCMYGTMTSTTNVSFNN